MWNQIQRQIHQLLYDDDAWNGFGWLEANTFMQPRTMVGQLSRDADLNPEAVIVRYFDGAIPEVTLGPTLSHSLVDRYNKVREIFEVLFELSRDREKAGDERDPLDIVLEDLREYYMSDSWADPEFLGEDDLSLAWHISEKFGVNFERDQAMKNTFRRQEEWDEKAGRNHNGDEAPEFDPDDKELPHWMMSVGKPPTVENLLVNSTEFQKGELFYLLGLRTKRAQDGWADPVGLFMSLLSDLARQIEEREPEMVMANDVWYRIPMLDGMPEINLYEPTYRGLLKVTRPKLSAKGEWYVLVDLPYHVLAGLWRLMVPDPVGQAWDIVKNMSRSELLTFVNSLSKKAKLFRALCLRLWNMNFGGMDGKDLIVPVVYPKVTRTVRTKHIRISMFGGSLLTRMHEVFERDLKRGPIAPAVVDTHPGLITAAKWKRSIGRMDKTSRIYSLGSHDDVLTPEFEEELERLRKHSIVSRESLWICEELRRFGYKSSELCRFWPLLHHFV